MPPPPKAIPRARDRLQSRILLVMVVPTLIAGACIFVFNVDRPAASGSSLRNFYAQALAVSLAFALLAWLVKVATPAAAAWGALICLRLTQMTYGWPVSLLHSGLPALALLFLLTSLATRFRRARKEARGLAEPRTGRRASQVIANLGVAALCAALSRAPFKFADVVFYLAAIAALAEATADTLSSEIGQAIAGPAILITTLRRVPPGTDGAVSLLGTLAGLFGAAAVVLSGLPRPFAPVTPILFAALFAAAVAGLFFDSLLGAALERRGWIGNDYVNFLSTAFSAAASYPLLRLTLRL